MPEYSTDPATREAEMRAVAGITDPTRPTPNVIGQSAAYHERFDTESVTLGTPLAVPHAWTSQTAKDAASAFCASAGLVRDIDAVLAAGGWPAELEKPWQTAHGRQDDPTFPVYANPMRLRAWAVQFASSLIDPTVPKPGFARWW